MSGWVKLYGRVAAPMFRGELVRSGGTTACRYRRDLRVWEASSVLVRIGVLVLDIKVERAVVVVVERITIPSRSADLVANLEAVSVVNRCRPERPDGGQSVSVEVHDVVVVAAGNVAVADGPALGPRWASQLRAGPSRAVGIEVVPARQSSSSLSGSRTKIRATRHHPVRTMSARRSTLIVGQKPVRRVNP